MALDAGFVAAVLEGIEGTLSEVIERVDISELRASLDVLQNRVSRSSGVDRASENSRARYRCTEEAVAVDV